VVEEAAAAEALDKTLHLQEIPIAAAAAVVVVVETLLLELF
jgi:hypothetical protein